MRVLLHVCCAPCAIYPVLEAKKENFALTGFFYNPNIHPPSEYEKRKKVAERFFKSEERELILPGYEMREFFGKVSVTEDAAVRCPECWRVRLDESASFAKENGFDAFTTTLLGSPYQGHEIIKDICGALSRKKGIEFYYKDYRDGQRDAHRLAREKGIYCQNYCGCVFSMVEKICTA